MEGLDLIAKVLRFQNPHKLPEGELLPAYKIPVLYSRSHISNFLPQVFSGFETCLTISELEVDLLLKVNQVLYDMMPDIARYPNDLQPEVARLIPALIMNLGNSKAAVRKSTHKCIGTFVKFSKKLELVISLLLLHGLKSKNQRTRQHSMLVVPALISLKPTVVEESTKEMHDLLDVTIDRLYDSADIVSKTAKKLMLEMDKCYAKSFAANYIDVLSNELERRICQLIVNNKFDEAQTLIDQAPRSQNFVKEEIPKKVDSKPVEPIQVAVKEVKPVPKVEPQIVVQTIPVAPKTQPPSKQLKQSAFQATGAGVIAGSPKVTIQIQPTPHEKVVTHENQNLSIVGREIVSNQTIDKKKSGITALPVATSSTTIPSQSSQTRQSAELPQAKTPPVSSQQLSSRQQLPSTTTQPDMTETVKETPRIQEKEPAPLKFGFLNEEILEQLSENVQWKDRNAAMETTEAQFQKAISLGQETELLNEANATAFVEFMYPLIPDINFKICIAALKMTSELLKRRTVQLSTPLFKPLVTTLLDKLSDSKEVIRKTTLQCCAYIIDNPSVKPMTFATLSIQNLHHANQFVRAGVIALLCRCVIVQSTQPADLDSKVVLLPLHQPLIEEICFLIKVEDKLQLQQMGIDLLALCIIKSNDRIKTETFIAKEFEIPVDSDPVVAAAKEKQLKSWLDRRVKEKAFVFINKSGEVDFHQWRESPEQEMRPKRPEPIITNVVEERTSSRSFLGLTKEEEILKDQQNHPSSAGFKKSNFVKSFQQHPQSAHQTVSANQVTKVMSEKPDTSDSQKADGQKIAMWLPTFTPGLPDQTLSEGPFPSSVRESEIKPSPQASSKSIQSAVHSNNDQLHNRTLNKSYRVPGENFGKNSGDLNATASSAATLIDERNRNFLTSTTLVSSNKETRLNSNSQVDGRTPMSFDDSHSNFRIGPFGASNHSISANITPDYNSQQQTQYIPESHAVKPRSIASGHSTISNDSNFPQNPMSSHQTTMSQSSGATGFDKMQINDRLQLLKSTFKYNNKTVSQQMSEPNNPAFVQLNDDPSALRISQQNSGPIRARHPASSSQDPPDEFLNVPVQIPNRKGSFNVHHFSKKTSDLDNPPVQSMSMTSKPPVKSAAKVTQPFRNVEVQDNDDDKFFAKDPPKNKSGSQHRVVGAAQQNAHFSQSEKKHATEKIVSSKEMTPSSSIAGDGANYDIIEEPLANADSQIRAALENLGSSDWAKQFEACNLIKRGVKYHKNLFPQYVQQVFKNLVKPIDSLRSQVSKNACLALAVIVEELSARESDPHLDTVFPVLLKRATDTNAFIREPAEAGLIQIILNCTETKVFAVLQNQNLRANPYKEKACMCYTVLIERLGMRLKGFRDVERLIQVVAGFLDESGVEVRNRAKFAVLTINNACSSSRELEGLLLKARLSDKLKEKVLKVIASEDFESLSNYNNTKYGAMRTSSNAIGAGLNDRSSVGSNQKGVGSDGFGRPGLMQNTFISDAGLASPQSEQRQTILSQSQTTNYQSDSKNNAFKKRNASISKPVDRRVTEDFKIVVDACRTTDWAKRVKAIKALEDFTMKNSSIIKSAAHSSFVQLVDTFCTLLQDNNVKVLSSAQDSFNILLQCPDLFGLMSANIVMVVQTTCQCLCSNNQQVRQQADMTFSLLENLAISESGNVNAVLTPLCAQISTTNNRAKAYLVERLTKQLDRVDKFSLIERQVNPLLMPNAKIQQEANGNLALRQALQNLEETYYSLLNSQDVGIGLRNQ